MKAARRLIAHYLVFCVIALTNVGFAWTLLGCSSGAIRLVRPNGPSFEDMLEIPNLFAAIVAYTGEVARHVTGGHWRLNEVHGGIWEPYIFFDNDSDYVNPFLEPYKSIVERRRGGLLLYALIPHMGAPKLKFVKPDWQQ